MRVSGALQPTTKSRLPVADRLLLWSIRAWVIGLKRRIDVSEPIRAAFGKLGVPDGAELIDALMSIVACGAARALTIECVCHEEVSEDERSLLAAAALHQQGRALEARFLLRTMLSPAASADSGEILDRLGALLAAAGITLFQWQSRTGQYVFGPAHDDSLQAHRSRLH